MDVSTVYIDKLSVYTIFVLSRFNYSHIFYFNASNSAKRLARLFKRLGIIKALPQWVDFHLADLRDDSPSGGTYGYVNEIRDLCLEIRNGEFANNDFLKKCASDFDFDLDKIILYCVKSLAAQINDIVVFINVARCHTQELLLRDPIVFFMEKRFYSQYLVRYALKFGIKLVEYNTIVKSSTLSYLTKGRKLWDWIRK